MKSLSDPAVLHSVIARVQSLTPDAKRQWGRMTPHQMMCHLTDSYKTGTGAKRPGSRSDLLPRAVMKWVALRSPLPWPKNLKTLPEAEQGVGGTPPVEFLQDRQELVDIIKDFAARAGDSFAATHPLFGPMNQSDWLRWGYLHADHHLRQFGL